ncbi:hypothetical protein CC2G_006374 [Coprinopsis cinerea AmutBmut pab1-1]|nr:hypothetical protein CC2G_006374 [Coprinopsis cinerea AmutBmut pab1-1]
MSDYFPTSYHVRLHFSDDFSEPDALSSSPGVSRPSTPTQDDNLASEMDMIEFQDLPELPEDLGDDFEYIPPHEVHKRQSPLSTTQKVKLICSYISQIPRFSLGTFLRELFASTDPSVTAYSHRFLSGLGHIPVMELMVKGCNPERESKVRDSLKQARQASRAWIIQSAAEICAKEASHLTDNAFHGPFQEEARFLRVSAHDIGIQHPKGFSLSRLLEIYRRTLPHLQTILEAIISKETKIMKPGTRDPDHGRTLLTSMLLNLRSRRTNYHAAMNSLILWDNRVPKRLTSALNKLGITTSYAFQCRAILSLSKAAVREVRRVANDPSKITVLPYDNFNWVQNSPESTTLHHSVQHDQVSALLIVVPTEGTELEGKSAHDILNLKDFEATKRMRHELPAHKSLSDILPSLDDHHTFRQNAIIHVARILTEEIPSYNYLQSALPRLSDPKAIPTRKTEEYYLPTFDQEQGSTRGNMVVLEHYFQNVLQVPVQKFENYMQLLLGDRLTTARDRAAQDQRQPDTSPHKFDHLSSFAMLSGLMHFVMNFMQAVGGTFWGNPDPSDPLSLVNLRDHINRQTINLRKLDYYGWIRFLDAILRALIHHASDVLKDSGPCTDIQSVDDLIHHATEIVDNFAVQSISRLEATKVKVLPGNTTTSNAIILFHHLLLLHEMQSAIKLGHPGRITRMLKFWCPIFYAAGSFNYANETMELLHNLIHDWPKDFATLATHGMLVNPRGRDGDWKPTDISNEHYNDHIKERAHGPNSSPELLEKVTPAMGHIMELTIGLFEELGVEQQNQKHSHVSQSNDIRLLREYLESRHVFKWDRDTPSTGNFINLFTEGQKRLSGPTGGHAKHLARHTLRHRSRHSIVEESCTQPDIYQELEIAKDATITPASTHLRSTVLEYQLDIQDIVTR